MPHCQNFAGSGPISRHSSAPRRHRPVPSSKQSHCMPRSVPEMLKLHTRTKKENLYPTMMLVGQYTKLRRNK